ncbi:MAG: FecR domain-containing protein [Chromatocurvus sp.]
MPESPSHQRSAIDQEACAWIAQFDGEEPSAADLDAFQEWINRSPRHREAIGRLSTLWRELSVLTELAAPRPPERTRAPRWRLALAFAGVATLLLAVVLSPVLIRNENATEVPVLYATAIGEQRSISLADGSTVQLNTGSQLRVAYGERSRDLFLLAGEGYFKVSHDPARPFVVHVDGRSVRAVGTAFSLRRDTAGLEVLVTEGVVELAERGPGSTMLGERKTILGTVKRGQRVRLADKLELAEPVSTEELARELAWRDGMLSFAGEPLTQVIDEISRYTQTRIVIEDPALSELRIGGYFRAGDTDAMLQVLQAGFPIEVQRDADGTVHLLARR